MEHLETAVVRTADAAQELTTGLADAVAAVGWHVATAESLTAGTIATVLAAAPSATTWLRGSLVAYSPEVKFGLGVPRGPVVTEECALILARRTAELLDADLCAAVTGVGGPEPDEGEAPGTVWFAVVSPAGETTVKEVFPGDPSQVLVATTARAIEMLTDAATGREGR